VLDLGSVAVSVLVWVLGWALGLVALYWVVRLAVRHALEDVDRHRDQPMDAGRPRHTPLGGH
jgi:hypothetical protein